MPFRPSLKYLLSLSAILVSPHLWGSANDYSASPNQGTSSSSPLTMLVMSVDHELFKKAYSNYSDIDGDGVLDTTYKDSINYLGYYDSNWCYQYTSNSRYSPIQKASGPNNHYCNSSSAPWSGNFMNWATMSRIDLLRRILYGGKRSTDTTNRTILERAYLPRDVHSFARTFDHNSSSGSTNAKNFTPYSEDISLCNTATSQNGSPKMQIARGIYSRWASTEVTQCGFGGSNRPNSSRRLGEHTVRVEACVNGKDASSDRCRSYPSGYSKPAGLLQKYGEDGSIRFGLISGSYDKNISGGVLRKNISQIGSNTNPSNDEINLSNGTIKTSVNGIIQQINRFRIAKYSYNNNLYTDCNTYGISVSSFKSSRGTNSNRHCSMWGNPIAEMYLEAMRYFTGQPSPTSAFNTKNDSRFVGGLASANWVNPINTDNACANCSIIVISSGANSFDADQLGSSSNIPGLSGTGSVNTKTNQVANIEYNNRFSGQYLTGGTGGTRQCTPKSLSKLSDARGICPELPQLEGSHQIAGLAFHGKNTDLRPDLTGLQNLRTYTIQLADNVPKFTFDVGGKSMSFQPVCQAHGNFSECSLIDVVVKSSSTPTSGEFLFTWEDSLWGNDYDYDASSVINYCIGSACSPSVGSKQIRISVRQEAKNAAAETRYSYTVTGTQQDGIQTPFASDTGSNQSQGRGASVTKTFDVVGNPATILPKPLELAAKYGGFSDLDNDGTPNHDANGDGVPDADTREWDNRNNLTGSLGADGIPDNYFFPNNPALLESQLGQILRDIASRISAGSSAALVSNSSSGVGSAIQALFRPKVTINNIEISWVGLMHSLFIDSNGHLREDSNKNATLDDYNTDKAVTLFFDPSSNQTVIQRYTSADKGVTLIPDGSTADLTTLEPVWDAREELINVTNVVKQRIYNAPANTGRHILTWLDSNNDNSVDIGETLPFEPATFAGGSEGYLGVQPSSTNKLIHYIRGEDQPGFRSRSVDYDNDGKLDVWRLGDIIHSNPTSVSIPKGFYSENKSFNSNDATFINFQNKYQKRRQVIYVGSNDGMIHAINGGFWDNDNNRFVLTNDSETSHPLGSEIWAYTPMNLLPHLRWLSEPDYPHVYYMDGEPLIFDANIFPDDTTHPGGWGTVLVMGMRLGGGPIDAIIGTTTKTMRSAYVVMDITDPEKPPELLAEITHPELGFTTNRPVVMQRRRPDASGSFTPPSENNWYLSFGSGPIGTGVAGTRDALDNASSNQNMKVFIYDLKTKTFINSFAPADSGIATSYAGNMGVVDWNNDFFDDAIYFGSVQTSGNLAGQLMRINLSASNPNDWILSSMMNVGRPITAKPTTVSNSDSERWIFAGTGRELTKADSRSTTQEYFFGVKEPTSGGSYTYDSVSFNSLIDTTDVEVQASGNLTTDFIIRPGSRVKTFNSLLNGIKSEAGWVSRLEHNGTDPSGKSISSAANIFALLLLTEYVPPADQCLVDGLSYLQALHYQTGTAIPANTQVVLTSGTITDTTISTKRVSLGAGLAPAPVVHQGTDGKTSVIIQGGAGNISSTDLEYKLSDEGRQSWRQIFDIPR